MPPWRITEPQLHMGITEHCPLPPGWAGEAGGCGVSQQRTGLGFSRAGTPTADEAGGIGSPALASGTAEKGEEIRRQVQCM